METEMKFVSALLFPLFIAAGPIAENEFRGVIDLMGSNCEPGPAWQPDGDFAAFVFCDSALGSNLGVVLSKLTSGTDAMGFWGIDKRFWQEGPWVTDITSIAWDPYSDRLFVATAEVYGDGGVFVLDLIHRKYERIYSIEEIDPKTVRDTATEIRAESHFGFIEALSLDKKSITVSIRLAYGEGKSKIVGEKTIRLGSGT